MLVGLPSFFSWVVVLMCIYGRVVCWCVCADEKRRMGRRDRYVSDVSDVVIVITRRAMTMSQRDEAWARVWGMSQKKKN